MHTEPSMEDRLWDYIDGLSAAGEKELVEALVAGDSAWTLRYQELLEVHESLREGGLETPSMRFTKNVMDAVSHYEVARPTRTYVNKNVLRGIAAFFLLLIGGFLGYGLAHIPKLPGKSPDASSFPSIDLSSYTPQVNTQALARLLNPAYISGFMLLLVIFAFVLLDAYLQRRRKAMQ